MSEKEEKSRSKWRLGDLIAFECALASDEREEWSTLRKRDASLGLERSFLLQASRRDVSKKWLDARLKQDPEVRLAADSIGQSISVAGQLLSVIAMLAGIGAATTALAYTGKAPVNVSAFFLFFILLQAVLAVVLLLAFALPRRGRETLAFGPIFRLGKWVLEAIWSRIQMLAGRFLSGQQRSRAAELAGDARRMLAVHGSVAKWLFFGKIQGAALWFNVGALIALLVSVAFSDRAFGWQTTLDVSTDSVQSLVKTVALPWSWTYGEGEGFPSREQIDGSRIVLKDGIQSLESGHLSAWWRFLALGIAAYGVLPRLLFWLLSKWQVRASLSRYDFRNASVERLMQRLRPSDAGFAAEVVAQGSELRARDRQASAGGPAEAIGQRTFALCSRELAEAFNLAALQAALARRWEMQESQVEPLVYDGGQMAAQVRGVEEVSHLAVVFESWMPPIKEIERQLRELRECVDKRSLLKIVLLGIPRAGAETISLKPDNQYAQAWHSFVKRLGDPYLVIDNPTI